MRPSLWWSAALEASFAQIEGRFEEAESFARSALEVGGSEEETVMGNFFSHIFLIRYEQGGLAELVPLVEQLEAQLPPKTFLRCMTALLNSGWSSSGHTSRYVISMPIDTSR